MDSVSMEFKENQNQDVSIRQNIFLLITTLLLGILSDVLFFEKPLGISIPIFVLAFYTVFFWNLRGKIKQGISFGWILSIPILLLSSTYLFFLNELFMVLNFVGIPVLIVAQTIIMTGENKYQWHVPIFIVDLIFGMFVRTFRYFARPFTTIYLFIRPKKESKKLAAFGKITIGLLITLPLMLIIISLLASADQVFENFMGEIPKFLMDINIGEFIPQLVIILFITLTSYSYLWSFLSKQNSQIVKLSENGISPKRVLDPVIIITILISVNIVYAFFTLIQFTYLFGSANYALPANVTYAEYARRGFFELILVTLINLTILLCSVNLTKKLNKVMDTFMNSLNSLLVLCTLVMLISAHLRMSLYEEIFGYTYLRVLTHAFMVFIFALLLVTLVKIWYDKIPLLKAYIPIALTAYVVVNFINIDQMIARNNLERYHNKGLIDVAYLSGLSNDATPVLVQLLEDKDPNIVSEIQNSLYAKKQALMRKNQWQAFNISNERAKEVLSKYKLVYQAPKVRNTSEMNETR